ncbi:hypothetical protein [Clavibacter michiganensis]|uniref:Uncharacterized protein n=2 Tax=Clavibacter michiganensis TaxID=28447 RepID=A0A251XMT1_CLAMM|nr:hypothetical protein [Clavibacter michiganensis]MBE3079197.1 hypothetical protein [Clavibacter michiganensis subsp. michiganensis]OUD87767.1 hypothetical protein BC477_07225 [Clavibacter michiganensis subsp. michiganensis]OUE04509.1 hypothetical protein CMMCAS07_06155 [Clavibacter michiganensis subsp. michiganensis]
MLVGLITGVAGAVLVSAGELNVFFTVPSVVAVVSGATRLTKREAPHR